MPLSQTTLNSTLSQPKGMRDKQRLATRSVVIEAAITIFATRGFDGTALPEVAKISGVTVPLIIYHFQSKEGLWKSAVAEIYRRVEAHMNGFETQISAASGIDFYRICARAHITALAKYPEYMRILFQEGTQHSPRLEWLVTNHQGKMTDRIVGVIIRAQAEALMPDVDPEHVKFILSGAFCLPIVLAPEYLLMTGENSLSEAFIERHIELCLQLMLTRPPHC